MPPVQALTLYGIPDDHRVRVQSTDSGRLRCQPSGNCPIPADLGDSRIAQQTVYVGGPRPPRRLRLSRAPQVIFNAIADPESYGRSLSLAHRICAEAMRRGMAVINPPRAVAQSRRENLAERLQGIERLQVPRVVRYKGLRVLALLKMLDAGEVRFPFLIRATDGFAPGWIRIDGRQTLRRLNFLPFDGRDYQVAPYRDCRGKDGLYRRYRMVQVGERLFPRHLVFSDHWRVSLRDRPRIMQAQQQLIDAEQEFLSDPFGLLGKELVWAIGEALARTGLDFAALDFTLDPVDGLRLLQCDACFDAFAAYDSPPRTADTVNAIRAALGELMAAKAGEAAVTRS